jgi:peroxiredoxin (alkyl hydroperoxide reductase subunit C)
MIRIGNKAPEFIAGAVINGEEIVENFSLSQYYGNKNVVFFFYPKDFTFVCPTELHAFEAMFGEFEKRDTVVVACSTDTEESHLAWLNTPKDKGGIQGVKYPIVADTSKVISVNYGSLGGEYQKDTFSGELKFVGNPFAYRSTFIIDKQGIVRHISHNDFPLGRNIAEYIRIVDAILHHEKHGEVCPANWSYGDEAMKESVESVSNYLSTH